jgi:hypothetical protein
MNSHDDFAELRRLLALKRHEQPPPGFFEDFSAKVITRVRTSERNRRFSAFNLFSWEASWLQRLLASVEAKPLYAGSFGLAVCGILLLGLVLSESAGPSLSAVPVSTGAPPQEFRADSLDSGLGQLTGFAAGQQQKQAEESLFKRLPERRAGGTDVILINTTGAPVQ